MNVIILTLFAIIVVFAFLEDHMQSWQKQIVLAVVCIAMICIATFKPMTTADAESYEYYFYANDDPIIEVATEPTFIWLSRLVLSLGGTITVIFFLYAVVAIPLKLSALWKTTPFIFTTLIVYIGIYFPMHDVVQIRCSMATAFLLWALVPLSRHDYITSSILVLIGTLFHYSALAFIPVLFVGNMKVTKYWKYALACIIPICLALYLVHIGAISLIPGAMIEGKIDLYQQMSETGNWDTYIPYKQVTFLGEFALLYVFLFYYDTIAKHCIYAPILVKILVIEMGFLTMFTEIPVLGGRLHDLFGPFNAIAFSCCLYCIKPRYLVRGCITIFALTYYLIQMSDKMYFP